MIPGAEPTVYEEVPDLEKLKVRFDSTISGTKMELREHCFHRC